MRGLPLKPMVLSVFCMGIAIAAGSPQLDWETLGPPAIVLDLASDDQIVVAVGRAPDGFAHVGWMVRAHDRRTGDLVWEDHRVGQSGEARSVALAGGRAFVAGTSSFPQVLTVRAYDLTRGTIEWEREIPPTSSGNMVAVRAGHVFVGGRIANGTTQQYAVLSLHAGSGVIEWTHVSDGAGPASGGVVWSVAASANDLFVSGDAGGSSHSDSSVFVRALSRDDATVVWENVIPLATISALPACLAVDRDLLFVCGSHHGPVATNDFMVRAYDARTGTLLWTDRPDDGGLWSSAMALTASGDKLFVIGQMGCDFSSGTPGCQSAVRAYDAQTGALAWQDLDSAFSAADIVADGESIIVAGSHTDASGAVAPTIRAYDPDTGALAWENRADPGAGRISGYSHVTVNGNGLFAGGALSEAPLFITRLYVRALSLRPSSSR